LAGWLVGWLAYILWKKAGIQYKMFRGWMRIREDLCENESNSVQNIPIPYTVYGIRYTVVKFDGCVKRSLFI
jgi:hypothetical protein